jgi:hypothetical protein
MAKATTSSGPISGPGATAGPLVVARANARYFTVASGNTADRKAIYLTGSHIWNNFHDGMGPGTDCPETPEQLDYDAYLKFLKRHGHNFIRLWRWEQFKCSQGSYPNKALTPGDLQRISQRPPEQ